MTRTHYANIASSNVSSVTMPKRGPVGRARTTAKDMCESGFRMVDLVVVDMSRWRGGTNRHE